MVAFNDLIKKHLKEDVLLKLVECLLVEKPEPFMPPNRLVSMCLVEALNAISTTSKCPTVLMDNIQQEETLIHIANCIVNGDVALMGKGLSLTGAVGFTPKCRNDLSKIMAAMRESSPKYGSTAISQDVLVTVSDKARFGVKKLNTNLEMFMQTYDGNDYAVDDVLSWHKMKSDMHEVEIASMRDQVFQLNRTIAQFKVLINKQSELITSRAESTSTLQKDFKHMKQMVESMKEKKIELETKHEKTTDALRKQLNYQEDLFISKSERMVQLEKQIIDFKEENKKLEAAKLEATQSTRQLTADNAKLQKKLDELESETKTSKKPMILLEKDLKKSEESIKASEGLLEAETRSQTEYTTPPYITSDERSRLPFETIVEEVQRLKRDGNDYYWNDKNYSFAIKKWKKAVTMIEAYPVGNEEDDQIRRELIWRLYASVAQGYLRLERPVEACSACNLGLKWADIHGESSLELYFRFAKAKLMLNDHKAALGLIKGALNIEPLNEQCLQLKLEVSEFKNF
ncbi:unnamed protein product [Orchesella dallaii]|uniref:Uncharacterized protein n=1 Tax=Orchesella dallaii TaxID=48710 RepID=A0ABP1PWY1_9HEXA